MADEIHKIETTFTPYKLERPLEITLKSGEKKILYMVEVEETCRYLVEDNSFVNELHWTSHDRWNKTTEERKTELDTLIAEKQAEIDELSQKKTDLDSAVIIKARVAEETPITKG